MLKPVGSGHIDILRNFRWKNSGSVDEVPSICLNEYELEFGGWAQSLARLVNIAAETTARGQMDPYVSLYNVKSTGFVYNFPYLLKNGDKMRSIQNNWSVNKLGGISKLLGGKSSGGVMEAIGQFAGNIVGGVVPGVGTEDIYKYDNTTNESITISFPLYNTNTTAEAIQNYKFVSLFTFQNLKTRTSFLTFIPPKLYSVKTNNCLGGLDWPVAIVNSLDIESIGTTRELSEFNGGGTTILLPEAYKVTISLKQLVPTSSNTFYGAIGGSSVNVFSSGTDTIEATRDVFGKIESLIKSGDNQQ